MPAAIDHVVTITGRIPESAKQLPMRARGLLVVMKMLSHNSGEFCMRQCDLAAFLEYRTGGGHITRMIRLLQAAGLIEVARRRGDNARVNCYRVHE
jgi:DNA-binding PadR family transcriptional regulator